MAQGFIARLLGRADDEDGTAPDGETAMSEQAPDETTEGTPDDGAFETPGEEMDAPGEAPDAPDEMAGDAPGAAATNGQTVDDLAARIDELENELSNNESAIRAVESNQEELADGIERIDDTVRKLLGVYDQVTASENPFEDDPPGARAGDPVTNGGGHHDDGATGDVSPDDEPDDDGRFGIVEAEHDADDEPDEPDDEPSVSFDDLVEGAPDDDPPDRTAMQETSAPEDSAPEEPTATLDEPAAADDPAGPTPGDGGGPVAGPGVDGLDASADAHLDHLPAGYARDVLVMEWLSSLVETSGTAGAMKALGFYEEVGWISADVSEALETYLSGPDLDADIDPNCPVELTATDHVESYQYVLRLQALEDIDVAFTDA